MNVYETVVEISLMTERIVSLVMIVIVKLATLLGNVANANWVSSEPN